MRGNHPGEGRREQQPEKTQPAPALGPKWGSPGWEHPWHHSWLGTAVAVQGCPVLRASSRISHSPSVPRTRGQISSSSSSSGMFSLSLAVLAAPRELPGGCGSAGSPCPAQLCPAVPWWPCLVATPPRAVPSPLMKA